MSTTGSGTTHQRYKSRFIDIPGATTASGTSGTGTGSHSSSISPGGALVGQSPSMASRIGSWFRNRTLSDVPKSVRRISQKTSSYSKWGRSKNIQMEREASEASLPNIKKLTLKKSVKNTWKKKLSKNLSKNHVKKICQKICQKITPKFKKCKKLQNWPGLPVNQKSVPP